MPGVHNFFLRIFGKSKEHYAGSVAVEAVDSKRSVRAAESSVFVHNFFEDALCRSDSASRIWNAEQTGRLVDYADCFV